MEYLALRKSEYYRHMSTTGLHMMLVSIPLRWPDGTDCFSTVAPRPPNALLIYYHAAGQVAAARD